ncbi:hypothetical protein M9H77_04827 [Catharanthus roseus]|uniref:Uncharacterized protein n=1 Tax=Catharanthus roseus TaxID=4058 RepID=A0ACC0CF59_CATRO|nr:hypothetical protein M9H77_04827 [Catharanthus roseus]
MESSEYSEFDSLKSEKVPNLGSKSSTSISDQTSDKSPWNSKTPEKPVNPPRRTRNHGTALSLKEVREAALKLSKSETDPATRPDSFVISAKEQIRLWLESSPSNLMKSDDSSKLPEKYEMLDKFFCGMVNAIQLLRIKRSATTFPNISPKIECLTDRRFTYSYLAQLKIYFSRGH